MNSNNFDGILEHLKNAFNEPEKHEELVHTYLGNLDQRLRATSPDRPIASVIKMNGEGADMRGYGDPDLVMFAAAIHMATMRREAEKFLREKFNVTTECCRKAMLAGLFQCAVGRGECVEDEPKGEENA